MTTPQQQSRPLLPQNRYVQRTAVKEGACFICGSLTSNIFVTEQSTPRDWFYVCAKHTSHPAFCTALGSGGNESAKNGVANSPQIADKAEAKPTADNQAAKKDESAEGKPGSKESGSGEGSGKPAPATAAPPARKIYVLHKDYMYLRQRPFIKKWESEQADILAKRLPSVPRGRPL
ncbi:hypothetical protein GQ54DRAFT_34083 [Martensiomyces pterosporus]|nr:hypothetical protein GQ54DRAFT_34083 [Martensiomyces pterosporus]